MANTAIALVLTLRGFERVFAVTTDTEGQFTFSFAADNESGRYHVSAVHPAMLARPIQGEFVLQSANISPSTVTIKIPRNYTGKFR